MQPTDSFIVNYVFIWKKELELELEFLMCLFNKKMPLLQPIFKINNTIPIHCPNFQIILPMNNCPNFSNALKLTFVRTIVV